MFQLVKQRGKSSHNKMDAIGRVQVIVRLVVPGRPNTMISGNIHRSFSLDNAKVSEVFDAISIALLGSTSL